MMKIQRRTRIALRVYRGQVSLSSLRPVSRLLEREEFMAQLLGHQIDESTTIQKLVQDLVSEVGKLNSQITGIRAAHPEHAENGKKEIERIGKIRGRPLYYPYVGSGAGNGVYVELEDGS